MNTSRHKNMATLAINPSDMVDVNIRIPKVDLKRMKGIAKAMGWSIFQTEQHTASEIREAQEAYVRETLKRAYEELPEISMRVKEETLDDFLNELD